jgi:hypothetical protein
MNAEDGKNEHARALSLLGAAKGGRARAESMTAEERRDIAKRGAAARWGTGLPRETHRGVLWEGTPLALPCANLDNGMRVLSASGISRAFGSGKNSPKTAALDGAPHPPAFLAAKNLQPFISDDLRAKFGAPLLYIPLHGGKPAYGYEATVLSAICRVLVRARGKLKASQKKFADSAEGFLGALADYGIQALVDEATGFRADSARDALARILERFIAKELRPWQKTFPAEFYEHIYKLRGWEWKGMQTNRIQALAHYTKDIVYARLAPGVLEELKRLHAERQAAGKPKGKMFQSLTEDWGHPKLREHLSSVVTLLRVTVSTPGASWESFMDMLDRAHPKYGETLLLLPPDPLPPPKQLKISNAP